jgi:hypothetical protein
MTFWEWLSALPPGVAVMGSMAVIIVALWLLYRGVIVFPWINFDGFGTRKKEFVLAEQIDAKIQEALAREREEMPDGVAVLCRNHERFYRLAVDLGQMPAAIVREQMSLADDVEQKAYDAMYRHYLKLVKEKNDGDVVGITTKLETVAYDFVIRYALARAKDRARAYFQANHLAEMTDIEFKQKAEERAEQITSYVSSILNDLYPSTAEIAREETYDWNQRLLEKVQKSIEDLFWKGREVALEFAEKRRLMVADMGIVDGHQ